MAVYREAPKCVYCGKKITGIYDNNSMIIGDNFIKWDYEGHVCDKNDNTNKMVFPKIKLMNFKKLFPK